MPKARSLPRLALRGIAILASIHKARYLTIEAIEWLHFPRCITGAVQLPYVCLARIGNGYSTSTAVGETLVGLYEDPGRRRAAQERYLYLIEQIGHMHPMRIAAGWQKLHRVEVVEQGGMVPVGVKVETAEHVLISSKGVETLDDEAHYHILFGGQIVANALLPSIAR